VGHARPGPHLALVVITLLAAGWVAGTPVIWTEKGVSFSTYRVVDVREIANETGKVFDFDVAHSLTDRVRSKLTERGVTLTEGGLASIALGRRSGLGGSGPVDPGRRGDRHRYTMRQPGSDRDVWSDTIITHATEEGAPFSEGVPSEMVEKLSKSFVRGGGAR
jgi:hypothetical protein